MIKQEAIYQLLVGTKHPGLEKDHLIQKAKGGRGGGLSLSHHLHFAEAQRDPGHQPPQDQTAADQVYLIPQI